MTLSHLPQRNPLDPITIFAARNTAATTTLVSTTHTATLSRARAHMHKKNTKMSLANASLDGEVDLSFLKMKMPPCISNRNAHDVSVINTLREKSVVNPKVSIQVAYEYMELIQMKSIS